MNIQEGEIWFTLIKNFEANEELMNTRCVSNSLYAFHNVMRKSPILYDFSDLFFKMEVKLIKRFLSPDSDS